MRNESVKTFWANIFIAGSHVQAAQICRQFCLDVGLCVTLEPTTFIYTGGEEAGVRIGLINYPRFPATPEAILEKARALAERLVEGLCQHSYSIVTPDETHWVTRREV